MSGILPQYRVIEVSGNIPKDAVVELLRPVLTHSSQPPKSLVRYNGVDYEIENSNLQRMRGGRRRRNTRKRVVNKSRSRKRQY